ncbi:MAG: methyltransferase domain-containing protein [Myxococcota bacterium]
MKGWDPEQYLRFRRERKVPYEELAAMVQSRSNMRIVDLSCGTGEWTLDLARRFDAASAHGVDLSETMLEKAKTRATERVTFARADLQDWRGEGYRVLQRGAALGRRPPEGVRAPS